jgi:soluble lytic murein transglycosylase-like protein
MFRLFITLTLIFSLHVHAAQDVDPELREYLRNEIANTDSFIDRFDAEVWLLDMSNRMQRYIKDEKTRLSFLRQLHTEATHANLPPELVIALIQVESAFKQYAVSNVGAQGFMQVMPFWKKEIGRQDDNLMAMQTNLRYGCAILSFYLKKEKGDWIRALARYNGSLGRLKYPEKVLVAWDKHWYVKNI